MTVRNKIVDTFPLQMRQVFLLWLSDNYKQTEIAEKLNIHPKTVHTQLKRAQKKICEGFAKKLINGNTLINTESVARFLSRIYWFGLL